MMANDDADMFAIRPDHKGPKTVAILLIVFSIFLGFVEVKGTIGSNLYMGIDGVGKCPATCRHDG